MRTFKRVVLPALGCLLVAALLAFIINAYGGQIPLFQRNCQVTGTVTRGGKPLEWKSDAPELWLRFAAEDPKKDDNVYRAEVDTAKGAYVVPKLPVGKYVVAVQLLDPPPFDDLLSFSYDLPVTPLRCEVKADRTFDIDLPVEPPKTRRGGRGPGGPGGTDRAPPPREKPDEDKESPPKKDAGKEDERK